MGIVGFNRLHCTTCEKLRWHECIHDLGRCVTCLNVRSASSIEIDAMRHYEYMGQTD